MNVKLTNKKTKKIIPIGEVKTVEIIGRNIKILDVYNQEMKFNSDKWVCVCSNFATCGDCGKQFYFDDETCAIYRGDFICAECFQDKYGYCNECGELNKYSDMNEDIVCKGCEKVEEKND